MLCAGRIVSRLRKRFAANLVLAHNVNGTLVKADLAGEEELDSLRSGITAAVRIGGEAGLCVVSQVHKLVDPDVLGSFVNVDRREIDAIGRLVSHANTTYSQPKRNRFTKIIDEDDIFHDTVSARIADWWMELEVGAGLEHLMEMEFTYDVVCPFYDPDDCYGINLRPKDHKCPERIFSFRTVPLEKRKSGSELHLAHWDAGQLCPVGIDIFHGSVLAEWYLGNCPMLWAELTVNGQSALCTFGNVYKIQSVNNLGRIYHFPVMKSPEYFGLESQFKDDIYCGTIGSIRWGLQYRNNDDRRHESADDSTVLFRLGQNRFSNANFGVDLFTFDLVNGLDGRQEIAINLRRA